MGAPRFLRKYENRVKGTPVPKRIYPSMAGTVSSYFSTEPNPSGKSAVYNSPQEPQRNASRSMTLAVMGDMATIRTMVAGRSVGWRCPLRHSGQHPFG